MIAIRSLSFKKLIAVWTENVIEQICISLSLIFPKQFHFISMYFYDRKNWIYLIFYTCTSLNHQNRKCFCSIFFYWRAKVKEKKQHVQLFTFNTEISTAWEQIDKSPPRIFSTDLHRRCIDFQLIVVDFSYI